jgi:tetratricopeptide (TPR) repeat protein
LLQVQNNYPEAINLIHQIIKYNEVELPSALWGDYKNLAFVYSKMGQHEQSAEALEKSLAYFQQNVNIQLEEQHQLAEVKFDVAKQQQQIQQQQSRILITTITAILFIVILFIAILLINRQRKITKLEKEKAQLIAEQAMAEKNKRWCCKKYAILNKSIVDIEKC